MPRTIPHPRGNYNARLGKGLTRRDPTRTGQLRKLFSLEIRRHFSRLFAEMRRLIQDPVYNVFCPTGEGGGVDPTCSPLGGVGSPSFKKWFGDSQVTDADGKPKLVFHGTLHSFDQSQFQTDLPESQEWGMLDRALGSHFAEDPGVTEAFTVGDYAKSHDFSVSETAGRSWMRTREGLDFDSGIPLFTKEDSEGRVTREVYDPKKHGGTWGVRDRHGDGTRLEMIPSGGRTLPVYLSIKNPLRVELDHPRESDQSAVHRVVAEKVFPESRELFTRAYEGTGRTNGGEVWDALKAGKSIGSDYEEFDSFADVARNFTGMLNGRQNALEAKAILEKLGYDGIHYGNTSQNEVKAGQSNSTWIAFRPTQIKSAFNKGTFNPSSPNILNLASTQFNLEQQDLIDDVKHIQSLLDPDDVVELEEQPHITVRYGLHGQEADQVQSLYRNQIPLRVKLGGLSLFSNDEQDVLKIDVESRGLSALHQRLGLLPNTSTHSTYHPHLTIAYLKPGTGIKYVGESGMEGTELTFDKMVFSNDERKQTILENAFCPTGPGGGQDNSCSPSGLKGKLESLKSDIAKAAQEEYDAWEQDEEGVDEECGSGGICDRISSRIADIVGGSVEDVEIFDGGQDGDDHAYPVIKVGDKAYGVDIPPHVYETGGGYSWKKIPDVTIEPSDVEIFEIDADWLTDNARTKNQHVNRFMKDYQAKVKTTVKDRPWWEGYINSGFQTGAGRAYDDLKKGVLVPIDRKREHLTAKREFLRSTVKGSQATTKKLYKDVQQDLDRITTQLGMKLSAYLDQAVSEGRTLRDAATEILPKLEAEGLRRAENVARYRTIEAHVEGQLAAFEELGVEDVGVLVEWTTTGNPCPMCAPMEGVVLRPQDAHGLIPRHVGCLCSFEAIDSDDVDEDDHITDRSGIRRAVKASIRQGARKGVKFSEALEAEEWGGAEMEVDDRLLFNITPELMEFSRFAGNAFCPTGVGGGVDPSCSPNQGGRSLSVQSASDFAEQLPLNEYGNRSGTKKLGPVSVKAFRVGKVRFGARGGVFFAGEEEGAKPYRSLHEGHDVEGYTIHLKNALLAGHQNDLTKLFFNKPYGQMMDTFQQKYGKKGAHVASSAFDKKLADEAKKRGYDGILYMRPAPPAKTEICVIEGSKVQVTHNQFCPTGEGGGVDPTCSPSSTTKSGEDLYSASRGKDKVWRTVNGQPAPEHIQKLNIPPAWKEVEINLNPKGTTYAKGIDAKGRVQTRYSDTHTAQQAAAKFGRTRELIQKRTQIYKELEHDAKDPELKEQAECLKLVMQTGMRPGSDKDTKADHKSYGATTLEGRHVLANKDGTVILRVVTGKNKGREVDFPVTDRATASMLKSRAKEAGRDGRLFQISSKTLTEYSKSKDGGGFKTKDHRTALGTETALRAIKRMSAPKSTEYKDKVKAVAVIVAKALGNTPPIALKSYIDPQVFAAWNKGLKK